MNDYLTEGWPLGPTSTFYMSGKAMFNIRRYGKPGIITTVEMFPADAQAVREAVQEAIREARVETLRDAADDLDPLFSEDQIAWLRTRAANIEGSK